MARKRQSPVRRGEVILPTNFPIVTEPELPSVIPTLPDPHEFRNRILHSWRSHARAHHRIHLYEPRFRQRYRRYQVTIPRESREFDPFVLTWKRDARGIHILDHYQPDRKVSFWMNKRQRDWKHKDRTDADHSRAGALRTINYRNPDYDSLYGAFSTGNPEIVADTAIVLNHIIGQRGY